MRLVSLQPVVEVINVDHEGEVGKGPQHEGGDEAGGDVVAWLPHKVDHHLKGSYFLSQCFSTKEINQPSWCLCFLLHQRWCSCWQETPQRTLCPCIVSARAWSGPDILYVLGKRFKIWAFDLGLDCVSHLELKLTVLLVKGEHAEVIVARELGKPPDKNVIVLSGKWKQKFCRLTFWSVWGHSCCLDSEPPPKQSRCRSPVGLTNKSKTLAWQSKSCSDQD